MEAYRIDNYKDTHARINRNKPHIVNVFGGVQDQTNGNWFLLVERIPSRLSQTKNLNEAQTLKVLLAVSRGLV